MKGSFGMDMTHGPLAGKIMRFALPLMAANLVQLLFNAADIVVVGRFAGSASLAAVSSTTAVIHLLVNLLIGLAVGVNVMLAQYIGMTGQERDISRTLHTALSVAILGGLLFAVVGFFASGWILNLMSVPDDIISLAKLYLRVYLAGTPFSGIYNYGAAALRARGDTKRPLMIMLVSGAVNLVLNLLFVTIFHLDVLGVALATIISQAISAVMTLHCLSRLQDAMQFCWNQLCVDRRSLVSLLRIGLPAGIQASLFSLSNVVIQGAINSYGSIVIAGVGAAENIEGFLYVSMNSFHQACQTFVGQNLGAGQYSRINWIVRICLLDTLVIGIVQSVAVCLLSHPLIGLYNTDAQVIAAGAARLWWVALVYVIFGLADVLVGAIRGCGIPMAPMIINLLGTCVLRLVWVAVLDTTNYGVELVYLSYPVSWTVILIAIGWFWCRLRKKGFDQLNHMDEIGKDDRICRRKRCRASK